MPLQKRILAEAIGTAWLVMGGCGAAIFAASNIGWLGVSAAFGVSVLTMAYALGHISGCHLNPAVTVGLWAAKRFPKREVLPYCAAQVVGAIVAATILFVIASGKEGFQARTFAANGYGAHSPTGLSLPSAFLAETVLTFMFMMIILGATDARSPAHFAPIAIGLGLTLVHLVGIPLTNTSVNPARSTGVALFQHDPQNGGHWALMQLWLFWLAPMVGSAGAAFAYTWLANPAAEARAPKAQKLAEAAAK